MALPPGAVTPDTLITLKVAYDDLNKRIKLPLKDLTASALPDKLRTALSIPSSTKIILERYSDSAGGYIVLDKSNVAVYKAVIRAAKAKGKLRMKVTLEGEKEKPSTQKPTPANPLASAMAAALPVPSAPIMSAAAPAVPAVPAVPAAPASFMCVKPRMSGAGIFEYRASLGAPYGCAKTVAPVKSLLDSGSESSNKVSAGTTTASAAQATDTQELAFRTRDTAAHSVQNLTPWSVYCNSCDAAMPDVHYHCGICDGGDYDLCETCVAGGAGCPGEDHWLIKRFIRDGKVVTSTTERLSQKTQKEAPEVKSMPGSFDVKPAPVETTLPEPTRTCNNCVAILPERDFVTCDDCDDFDLCIPCHISNDHGHSAKHSFQPATKETDLSVLAHSLLKAGRNVAHNAICDGCNKKIFGVRHKCLNCPDWDFCTDCHASAGLTHPRHRFAPIYEKLIDPVPSMTRHFGIYCDGPLCRSQKHQTYIIGERYKCAVCHDTDFCANCEASPSNIHNRTHPLIKFRTAVRNVSITTTNEDNNGNVRNLGDRRPQPSPVTPVQPANASIAVQTVAEIPPTEEKSITHAVVQPRDGDVPASPTAPAIAAAKTSATANSLLTAAFVRDSIADGTVMLPGATFTQIWTLRNEGPYVWPAGCSVRFVGGDNMLNVDNFHPASVSVIAKATESSVVAREVQVGEEISFRITLRAPIRQGKSISYWRLKAADGTPFGHRLWCDIEVRSSAVPEAGEKVINAPTQPSFTPAAPPAYQFQRSAESLRQMSRVQAMRETQLRLLQHQRMLQHAQQPRTEQRAVSTPVVASQPAPSIIDAEKVRKEAAKARVEAIKAKIMRYRAENEKLHAKMQSAAAPLVKTETAAEKSPVIAVKEEDEAELGASSTSSSQMVFPKLEKESPASSVISAAKPAFVQSEDGEVEHSAAIPAEVEHEEEPVTSPLVEDFDDLEVVSAGIASDDDSDDGFLTDEEYDILDASDRETVASP